MSDINLYYFTIYVRRLGKEVTVSDLPTCFMDATRLGLNKIYLKRLKKYYVDETGQSYPFLNPSDCGEEMKPGQNLQEYLKALCRGLPDGNYWAVFRRDAMGGPRFRNGQSVHYSGRGVMQEQ